MKFVCIVCFVKGVRGKGPILNETDKIRNEKNNLESFFPEDNNNV